MTPRKTWPLLLVGAAALAALLVYALVDPRAAAAGWLVGFVFWMQILSGSLGLAMIHRLTSGTWGETIAPVAGRMVASTPLLIVLAIPLFVAMPALYPWVQHPASIKPDVLTIYLNRTGFVLRSLVSLGGWTLLAFLLPRTGGRRGQLLAAIGLVFYAVTISSVSIDWYLSVEAPFTSSSFGASVAICSLVAALSWIVVWLPLSDDVAIGDVGGLLLATVLGLTYIDFMAVLVIWYGDLPREEIWFVARSRSPWAELAGVAFVLTSLVPIAALIQSRFRNRQRPLRYLGAMILVGLAGYDVYLVVPPFGVRALGAALLALIGIGFLVQGVAPAFAEQFASPSREAIDVP